MRSLYKTVILALSLAPCASFAGDWTQLKLPTSKGGYQITINYQLNSAGSATAASPLWINLDRPGNGRVSAVLINYRNDAQISMQTINLDCHDNGTQVGHDFQSNGTSSCAGQAQSMIVDAPGGTYRQEIAVEGDFGTWEKSPTTGNNYRFDLLKNQAEQ